MNSNFDKEIEAELERYSSLMTRDPSKYVWEDLRDIQNYHVEIRQYDCLKHAEDGRRTVLVPVDLEANKDVQTTRTINVADQSLEELKSNFIANSESMCDNDISRSWELDHFLNSWSAMERLRERGSSIYPEVASIKPTKFCEIGFRNLKLMKFYEEKYSIPVKGYDVSAPSVYLAKAHGYDAHWCDLNCEVNDKNLDLSDCNLVVCYHVLEHVVDPLSALHCIYNSMPDLSVIHVEVPIELNRVNYMYGHVFGFHPLDLEMMMNEAGFHLGAQTFHHTEAVDGDYRYTRVIGIKGMDQLTKHYPEIVSAHRTIS